MEEKTIDFNKIKRFILNPYVQFIMRALLIIGIIVMTYFLMQYAKYCSAFENACEMCNAIGNPNSPWFIQ